MEHNYYSTIIVTNGPEVLMRKREGGAHAEKWEMPRTKVDFSTENFTKAAARLAAGEMRIPLSNVEMLGVMDEEFPEYDEHIEMTFYLCTLEDGASLDHLDQAWEWQPIRLLSQDNVVPENVQVFNILGHSNNTGSSDVPVERN